MSTETSSTFGHEIKRLREQRGISQSDLANKAGCSVDTIRKIENYPRYRTSEALAERLGRTLGITGAEEVASFIAFARSISGKQNTIRPIEDKTDRMVDEAMNVSEGITLEETAVCTDFLGDSSFSIEIVATKPNEQLEPSSIPAHRTRKLLAVVTITLVIGMTIVILRWISYQAINYLRGPIPLVSPVNSGVLNPALSWQQGDSLDSSYILDKVTGSLTITAGGNTDITKEGNTAPIITFPVQGDFSAQVMVVFQPGSKCCKHAGIGVRAAGDDRSWIRISRDHADTIQLSGLLGERSTIGSAPNYTQDRVWLKIERRGNRFTLSYSTTGVDWIPLRKDYTFPISQNAQIFLFVYSAHQDQAVSAKFSHLIVE